MDNWHAFWFLRPLIIIIMASPTLIIPALLALRKKRPEAGERSETQTDQKSPSLLSASGTWRTDSDGGTPSIPSDGADSSTQQRAA